MPSFDVNKARWPSRLVSVWVLVIAHPDDESMFFLPSLMMMREREVHILSLSNGGAVGLGATRAEEMECAARWHGAKARIIDDPRLADGATWDEKVVAERVRAYLDEVGEAIGVVTFDWRGASGHSNHVATSAGVRLALRERSVIHFELETVDVTQRFLGPLAIAFARFASDTDVVTYNIDALAGWRAMTWHASQFVWYRKAFVVLSAYTFVNRLRLVPPEATTQRPDETLSLLRVKTARG